MPHIGELMSELGELPAGSSLTVEDEGSPVTQRGTLNFTGAGVTVTDTGSKTQVSIPGGAGEAFPVGSVFIGVVATNPATLLGYGTWSSFGAGRVLIGIDSGDTDFDTVLETGGAKTVASAGSVSAPTLSGSTASGTTGVAVGDHAAHTHSVTSNVAVGDHTFTQPTISWPVGVPTASGAAVADHSAHTHSVTSDVAVANHSSHTHTYTEVPNHTHPHNLQGGTTGSTSGTNVMASTATGGSARAMAIATSNPTGGVATGTTAGPSATLTHSVTNNAVTSGNPSATLTHSVTQPTIAWPVGVPTNASGAVNAHSVTNNAVTSGNPSATLTHSVTDGGHSHSAGTLAASAPTYTGSATSVVQPYIVVHMWQRTA